MDDDDEVVCQCILITVKDIKDAINNGAKSFEEVQTVTKVGTGCAECVASVRELVDKLLLK